MTLPRLVGLLVLAGGLVACAGRAAEPKTVRLFDGKSFDGWSMVVKPAADGTKADPLQTWSVVDGEIHCTGKPNGYLVTKASYANYVLRLKWRYPAGTEKGNSGVLIHVQPEDKVWPVCFEAQLRAGRAGDVWLNFPPETSIDIDRARFDLDNKDKRHYWRIGKDDPIEKPAGEWNDYEIRAVEGDLTLIINGKKVNEGTKASLKKGRIALQSEGTPIHFKDLELTLVK